MRGLRRNMTPFYYCLYEKTDNIVDAEGNKLPEQVNYYKDPVRMMANISPATGAVQMEQFGNLDSYDKVIVTCDMDCPIEENTVLFIDKEPEFADAITHEVIEGTAFLADDEINETPVKVPLYDYIVRRVAKSLNSISIAVQKVSVS